MRSNVRKIYRESLLKFDKEVEILCLSHGIYRFY